MNVVVAAGEIMAELVREQYGQQGERERQAANQRGRLAIEQRKRADEFVPGDRLILSVGRGEMRARHETGTEREEKQRARHDERLHRRMPRYRRVVGWRDIGRSPIDRIW